MFPHVTGDKDGHRSGRPGPNRCQSGSRHGHQLLPFLYRGKTRCDEVCAERSLFEKDNEGSPVFFSLSNNIASSLRACVHPWMQGLRLHGVNARERAKEARLLSDFLLCVVEVPTAGTLGRHIPSALLYV